MHSALVLSAETEKQMVIGAVDVAYQNLLSLERTTQELRDMNDSLAILSSLDERVGVLRDVLSVETEKMWNSFVIFSEEGDISLTIRKDTLCNSQSRALLTTAPTENPSFLSVVSVAELLDRLNLLESSMKTLSSLLSRAFFEHLLANPVGWQFIYQKHDLTAPSITMTPTNLTLANLAPHACIHSF